MAEINLLKKFPSITRPLKERERLTKKFDKGYDAPSHSTEDILIEQQLLEAVRQFGFEYFDGDRMYGYGGYHYDPKFWTETVKLFIQHYQLPDTAAVLDVGCAKGYLIVDLLKALPRARVAGLDVSAYALNLAPESVKPHLTLGSAESLPYQDKEFDLVVSINSVHSLPPEKCAQAIKEIERVSKTNSYIVVNAWRTEAERQRLMAWNITAQTMLHVDDWKALFGRVGYTGDYSWFIP